MVVALQPHGQLAPALADASGQLRVHLPAELGLERLAVLEPAQFGRRPRTGSDTDKLGDQAGRQGPLWRLEPQIYGSDWWVNRLGLVINRLLSHN